MTARYDLNAHLHCGEDLPAGAMHARVKTPLVVTVHPHAHAKAHRPIYAVAATVDGELVLGARFACGSASINVRPIPEPTGHVTLCGRCEQAAASPGTEFVVYAYYDATGAVLYVGQTVDLTARHKAHRKTARWYVRAEHRAVLSRHLTRDAARCAEAQAIAELNPVFNRQRPLYVVGGEAGVA